MKLSTAWDLVSFSTFTSWSFWWLMQSLHWHLCSSRNIHCFSSHRLQWKESGRSVPECTYCLSWRCSSSDLRETNCVAGSGGPTMANLWLALAQQRGQPLLIIRGHEWNRAQENFHGVVPIYSTTMTMILLFWGLKSQCPVLAVNSRPHGISARFWAISRLQSPYTPILLEYLMMFCCWCHFLFYFQMKRWGGRQ